mmetsp:Transcript_46007/g.103448  ORF Transcript_46007/g.103448 Transcript_46007/m.103448 type:complete len:219 (+) Transcript_46007:120-776(+)
MYGLRLINNVYTEHAGDRSGFIIVGHPEYNKGKSDIHKRGISNLWDTRRATCPPKHLAAKRPLRTLVHNLSSPEPLSTLKERSQRAAGSSSLRTSSTGMLLQRDFNAFLAELNSPQDVHISGETARTPASFAERRGWATACRHFHGLHGELDEMREQLRRNPEAAKEELLKTGSWKYYAVQLKQEKQLKTQFRKDCLEAAGRHNPPLSSPGGTRRSRH